MSTTATLIQRACASSEAEIACAQGTLRVHNMIKSYLWFSIALMIVVNLGCTATKYATLREAPKNPLSAQLNLFGSEGPQPSERTMQLLRRANLVKDLNGDPTQLQAKLHQWLKQEPNSEHYYAVAELAYIGALKKEKEDPKVALDLYGEAVMHAYLYLFDPQLDSTRNPYDPQYRGASDLYNTALEGALRIDQNQGVLHPGMTHTITTATRQIDVTCVMKGAGWHNDDFQKFEFVSDYEVEGLTNNYRTHGLGVPLIAVRQNHADEDPAEQYYPPNLSVPVTAFLRVVDQKPATRPGDQPRLQAVLELCDPLSHPDIEVAGRLVPLESNLTTPLAYFLSQPELDAKTISTFGLLMPEQAQDLAGIYMLQPYEPGKIPVIMVHGLWSTPFTWMEMFNDLRSDPELRDNYQFWFYMYPTGPPFWFSAAQMRVDIAELRQRVDPQHQEAALDQMVLVGHSMGGLVSKLQAVESGDEFWRIVSNHPIDDMKATPELREKIASTLYFQPNPSVKRVITIATPHKGSSFANDTTSYLSKKLITQPMQLMAGRSKLLKDNPNFFNEDSILEIQTSIDSLSPESPFLQVLYEQPLAPTTKIHTVIGEVPASSFLRRIAGTSDGVVHVQSAKLPGAASELTVEADHSSVHAHPLTVLEVRRILREHLAELEKSPGNPVQFARQTPNQTQPGVSHSHTPQHKTAARFVSPAKNQPAHIHPPVHQILPHAYPGAPQMLPPAGSQQTFAAPAASYNPGAYPLPSSSTPNHSPPQEASATPLPQVFAPTTVATDEVPHNMQEPVYIVPQPPEPKLDSNGTSSTATGTSPRRGTGTIRFTDSE